MWISPKLELTNTFANLKKYINDDNLWSKKSEYDLTDYWEIGDMIHVTNYALRNDIRIIATIKDGNKTFCNYRTGSIVKCIEVDSKTGNKNVYIGFEPDWSDDNFALLDQGQTKYDIKFAAIRIDPIDEVPVY